MGGRYWDAGRERGEQGRGGVRGKWGASGVWEDESGTGRG